MDLIKQLRGRTSQYKYKPYRDANNEEERLRKKFEASKKYKEIEALSNKHYKEAIKVNNEAQRLIRELEWRWATEGSTPEVLKLLANVHEFIDANFVSKDN
jgi:superfamily II RNA helicase